MGVRAVLDAPDAVEALHRRYVAAGCDVPVHWIDVARRAVGLARSAAADGGRRDEVAVAFIGAQRTSELLAALGLQARVVDVGFFEFNENAARRKRMAVLVSRSDHCLLDLLWRWRRGQLEADAISGRVLRASNRIALATRGPHDRPPRRVSVIAHRVEAGDDGAISDRQLDWCWLEGIAPGKPSPQRLGEAPDRTGACSAEHDAGRACAIQRLDQVKGADRWRRIMDRA